MGPEDAIVFIVKTLDLGPSIAVPDGDIDIRLMARCRTLTVPNRRGSSGRRCGLRICGNQILEYRQITQVNHLVHRPHTKHGAKVTAERTV